MPPFVMDVNLIDRLSFNPGEPILLGRAVYSTFTSPVTGTVQYQITGPVGLVLNGIANTTFYPGMNSNMVVTSSAVSLPLGSYTLSTIATAQGESSGNTVTFEFAGGPAPSFSFGPLSTPQELVRVDGSANEIPISVREVSLDDRVKSRRNIVLGSK